MKTLAIIIGLTLVSRSLESPPLIHRLIILRSSTLDIDGATNVNSYKCAIAQYTGKDTLVLHEGGKSIRPVFVKGAVELDASSFDCGMDLITADFHKTINSKEYPAIVIDFISFERMPAYSSDREHFKGILKISLGGVTRLFEVNCGINADPSGVIHLTGQRDFLFSDFKLIPPTRLLGALRVNNALSVSFHLKLRLDPNS